MEAVSTAMTIMPTTTEWAQIMEMGKVAVKSGFIPTSINTAEKAAIIILKGRELRIPPMVAFAHIHVINGKPTISAELMLAYIYKDHPSAQIKIIERNATKCVIQAKRPNETDFTTFVWDMDRAKKMQLDSKDNWKKQPETMLFWRNISEMKRAKFPEVLMGIDYTPEELGAEINETGELKDVTSKGEQTINSESAPPPVQTIKNFAPQTLEEAIDMKKERDQRAATTAVSASVSPVDPSAVDREKLIAEVQRLIKACKMSAKDLVTYVKDTFGKNTTELSNLELIDLCEYLGDISLLSKEVVNG